MKQFTIFNQLTAMPKRLAMVLTVLFTLGVGSMLGASIEINTTNSGVNGSYRDYTFDVNSVTFGCTQWMKNSNIQAKKSTTNSLYNVDAIPGTITSIVVKQTGTARAIKIYGGTASKPTTQITSPSTAAEMTFDFTGKDYTYFSLTTPDNACYFDKITINYTSSGGGNTGGDSGDDSGGSGSGECTWQLVTDASTLKAGDRVVIAAKDYNYAISTTQNINNRGQAAITKEANNITFSNDVQILTLQNGTKSGTFAFQDDNAISPNGYLYAASSGSNHLKTETKLSDNSSWSITIADGGTATLKAQGSYTRNVMQYNQSSSLFACYSSASQKALVIYKEVCTSSAPTTYTVTLNPNGGTGDFSGWSNYTMTVDAGTEITLPGLSKTGYNFAGWYDGELVNSPYTVTKTVTLAAQWTAKTITITWNLNYIGAISTTSSYTYDGATIALPTPNRTGYTFNGWFTAPSGGTQITEIGTTNKPTSDVTYYAQWTQKEYTVTAQSNNTSYGTVSLNGTTITASPKTGYRVSTTTPYTISPSNSAKVTQNGNTFTVTPSANTTITIYFEAIPTYTVTLNAGPGTCAASVTETSAGAGVTLPTPTLDCGEWKFAGWATSAVATETSSKPATLLTGTYKPKSNITLYAVYQKTETTQGGGSSTTTSDIFENGGTYTAASGSAKAYIIWVKDGIISIKQEQNTSTSPVADYTQEPRWYASHKITITPLVDVTSITITTQSGYADELSGATYTNAVASYSSNTVTITPDSGSDPIYIVMDKQARLSSLTVTYTTSGGGSTTYYHSTPDCSTPAPTPLTTPTNLQETITCQGVTLAWGAVSGASKYEYTLNGTSTQIDKSSTSVYITPVTAGKTYTWTVKAIGDGMTYSDSPDAATRTFTSYYSVTYNLNGGSWNPVCENSCAVGGTFTICSTEPTKDGYNFKGWSTANDATVEYAPEETITVTENTTLYAVWEQKKYTVNWYVNGTSKREQTDVEGAALTDIPEPTTADCDNSKVFVGWTTTIDYSHATDAPTGMITNTTGMKMPEGGEDYYAVFATSSGGSGSVDYSSTHTSNVPINDGTAITNTNVIIESKEYAATKAGTGSASGSVVVTIPAGTTQLSFHMAGWNGEGGKTIGL